MEDVYTIKVKTKPDTRNLYPSERRYSASTVSGLAWVHIALAATSFLLACLALVNPNINTQSQNTTDNTLNKYNGINGQIQNQNDANDLSNEFENENSTQINSTDESNYILSEHGNGSSLNLDNSTDINGKYDSNYILVLAPALITIFGLAAGVTSILASVRWYIDHNITWLFVMSCLSTLISLTSFIMIAVWFITTSEGDITEFYKDKVPFKDYFVIKHNDVIVRNESHMIVALNAPVDNAETPNLFTKRVLSINILIAAFLELLWSILSVKIAYKGMRNTYKDDNERRHGNCISVVTKIKGNDPRKMPRNGKLIPPKPDLIDHYPSRKIKKIFLAQSDNGFYLKNQGNKNKQTETSSEFYKERMMNFLNRCASLEGMSNPEMSQSVHSEALNPIPEGVTIENVSSEPVNEVKDRMTPISWGDTPDHTVYNQNTLNLDKIFKFIPNPKSDSGNDNE
ncbi:unnamed protein product [Chrysodeixis includens]|uniref:Uncharacterized protein n=1 Tax=Chrysodeixis includens TaxID=689277 RepID=A0A9P0E1Z1_CHRIL|nr:unnamed protein product [Chrysodeixis includens]